MKCTESSFPPTLDALVAGLGAGTAVAGLVIGESGDQMAIQGGVGAGVALLFALSAAMGGARVSKCRALLEQADENDASRAARINADLGTRAPLSRHLTPAPPAPPRALVPMQCVADVDCGAGKMCELGQCMPLQVAP